MRNKYELENAKSSTERANSDFLLTPEQQEAFNAAIEKKRSKEGEMVQCRMLSNSFRIFFSPSCCNCVFFVIRGSHEYVMQGICAELKRSETILAHPSYLLGSHLNITYYYQCPDMCFNSFCWTCIACGATELELIIHLLQS